MTPVLHNPGCACRKPIHRFKCRHCGGVVGWCFGADDEAERRFGPICDDCAVQQNIAPAATAELRAAERGVGR